MIGYHAATSIADACALAERYGDEARFVTGGTAIAILLRQGLIAPEALIGIGGIRELRDITTLPDGTLRLGGAIRLRVLENDERLLRAWPMVAAAIRLVATARIRNMATLGGGLAHADPAQDPPIALAAANATIVVAGPAERRIPAADFSTGYYETQLAPGELVAAVELPARPVTCGGAYLKFLPRSVEDYGVVTAAASVDVRAGVIHSARIAVGAVAPHPIALDLTAELRGKAPDAAVFDAAVQALRSLADPLDDVRGSAAYKREMAVVFARRALIAAADDAQRPDTSEAHP